MVLGIRGTTTLSDALTDAVGEATQAPPVPMPWMRLLRSGKKFGKEVMMQIEQIGVWKHTLGRVSPGD